MSEFNYKQRPTTKEFDEGWDRIFKKGKKVTLKEARKKALEIGKKAEEERKAAAETFYENNPEILTRATAGLSKEDVEEVKEAVKNGIPVFYE